MEGTCENKSDEFGIRAVKRPEAFGTINPFSLTIESSRRFAVALGEALLNRPQPRYEASSTHHVPQRPAHHSNAAWQACSCIVSHCWRWKPMPAPLSLPPLQRRRPEGRFSVQMHVHYQRNCPSEVAQCRLFTSPSSSMSPTLLAVNPPTMERTSQYCGGQGAAPRCLPLGRPSCTLRCSFPTREWGENSDASCRPTCHRIDGQTTCHFLPTAVHRPIVHHHQTKSKADARYGSARR